MITVYVPRDSAARSVGADEVEHGEAILFRCVAQTATKLLEKHRQAFCRSQKHNGINLWNI
jgi:hypothetical protein